MKTTLLYLKWLIQTTPKFVLFFIYIKYTHNGIVGDIFNLAIINFMYNLFAKPKLNLFDIISYHRGGDLVNLTLSNHEPIFIENGKLYVVRVNSGLLINNLKYSLFELKNGLFYDKGEYNRYKEIIKKVC